MIRQQGRLKLVFPRSEISNPVGYESAVSMVVPLSFARRCILSFGKCLLMAGSLLYHLNERADSTRKGSITRTLEVDGSSKY